MARFMMAMLPSGRQELEAILRPETLELMMARALVHDFRVNAQGLGFYEKSSHGLRILGHGGNTRWFHSDLALIPELDVGIFVSYNSSRGAELSFGPFLNAVLDQYFPQPPPTVDLREGWEERLAAVSGTWRFNRASYTTFQKAVGLVSGLRIQPAAEDGVLLVPSLMGGQILLPNMLLPPAVAAQVGPAAQHSPFPPPLLQQHRPTPLPVSFGEGRGWRCFEGGRRKGK